MRFWQKGGSMDNETRSSRNKQGMKTSTKVLIGIILILISITTGIVVSKLANNSNEPEIKKTASTIANNDSTSEVSTDKVSSTQTNKSSENLEKNGNYVLGEELEDPHMDPWKETTLGAGRDADGKRDKLINGARDNYELGPFQKEYVSRSDYRGGDVYFYKILSANGYIIVRYNPQSPESQGRNVYHSKQLTWQIVNVYKYK